VTIAKRIERKLVCELSEAELQLRSASLADTVTTIDQTKAARKEKAKEFGDLLAGLEDRQRELSRAIRTGIEERLVACAVNFHAPAEGVKTIIRLDTGELVGEEQMSSEECQTKIWHEPEVTIENPTPAQLEEFASDGRDAIAAPAAEKSLEQLAGEVVEAGLAPLVIETLRDHSCDAMIAEHAMPDEPLEACPHCEEAFVNCVCVSNGSSAARDGRG
jgi:hypothetical protein